MWIAFRMVAACGAGAEMVQGCKDGASDTHVSLWDMECGPGGCRGQERRVEDAFPVSRSGRYGGAKNSQCGNVRFGHSEMHESKEVQFAKARKQVES